MNKLEELKQFGIIVKTTKTKGGFIYKVNVKGDTPNTDTYFSYPKLYLTLDMLETEAINSLFDIIKERKIAGINGVQGKKID